MTIPIVIFCVESNSGAHWHIGRLLGGLNQHFWGENPIFRGEKVSFLRFFTPGTSRIANLTPESDSTPKITIETTLRWALAQNWRFFTSGAQNLGEPKRYCPSPLIFSDIYMLVYT